MVRFARVKGGNFDAETKAQQLINAIEQGKVNDEEFAILKRLVEKRGREAAQVTVTPVDTVQYCSPSPQTPKPSSGVCVNLENNEGRMDPERGELEPPSAGTGLETDSSVPRTRRRGRKDGPLLTAIWPLAWNRTKRETFLHPRRNAWTREPSELRRISLSCSRATSPKTRIKAAKRTSSLTQVGKERKHRFGTRLYFYLSFPRESVGPWEARCLCFVFVVCVYLSAMSNNYCSFQVITSQ